MFRSHKAKILFELAIFFGGGEGVEHCFKIDMKHYLGCLRGRGVRQNALFKIAPKQYLGCLMIFEKGAKMLFWR